MSKLRFTVEKKGRIYIPRPVNDWKDNSVITPTPILLSKDVIRIYCGFRDASGVSRLGYLDVFASRPEEIIAISDQPLLSLGKPGAFDDNGMILGDVLKLPNSDRLRMYYVGFQQPKKAKFLAFSGAAESEDGLVFGKVSGAPVMDRVDNAMFIRAIHTVFFEGNTYKTWYSIGDGWETISGIPYPRYHIHYTESENGIDFFDRKGIHCIGVEGREYRIGRPRVFKIDNWYHMLFTYDTLDKKYRVGYAFSRDGIDWHRDDQRFPLDISSSGWDSEMVCYPVPVFYGDKMYLFYSGNGMGYTGLGYATVAIKG